MSRSEHARFAFSIMSGTVWMTSKIGKPRASCVVPTLGAVMAVVTD